MPSRIDSSQGLHVATDGSIRKSFEVQPDGGPEFEAAVDIFRLMYILPSNTLPLIPVRNSTSTTIGYHFPAMRTRNRISMLQVVLTILYFVSIFAIYRIGYVRGVRDGFSSAVLLIKHQQQRAEQTQTTRR